MAGHRTLADPLVFILHLSYAWLPLGLALVGAALLWPAAVPLASAMASMILAVMTRASLSHTDRPLIAGRAAQEIYALVTAGALARVLTTPLPLDRAATLNLAGLLWSGAFLLFAIAFGPILIGPRPDAKP